MKRIESINEFVVRFANVNGTGSASANGLFAKAMFRLGLPVGPKNIFPSNIQGLPTFYEVRVSEKRYLGRRDGGADIVIAMNSQSMNADIDSVATGGYLIYDSTKPLTASQLRQDITIFGIPITEMCIREYQDARQRLLFKNMIYIGALAALIHLDFEILVELVGKMFKGKDKLIVPNVHALEMGYKYACKHFECPIGIQVRPATIPLTDEIIIDGNTAAALGAVYGGATVCGWYPITPSTSVIEQFSKYCDRLRIEPVDGSKNYAIVQAEDELSAIGIAVGGAWNGARSFTATSGPGISLMSEFLGLAYFAEVPVVLVNIQRSGPSTGMPTRTQQSDVLACAYASHGDTRQVLLFPGTPAECFELTADAFDLAERLQTPVILMSDLNLGMNDHLSAPLAWDKKRRYDRGKVLSADQLEQMGRFGRYLDVDQDGICYRTLPGTHPTKGSFFTRGSSRDEYAVYTERGEEYVKNVDRLKRKFKTASQYLPEPEVISGPEKTSVGVIYYGTTEEVMHECADMLADEGISVDRLRIKAFPFGQVVEEFIAGHDVCFVVDQNRDGQMRTLLIAELEVNPGKLESICHYDGMPVTARFIADSMKETGLFTEQSKTSREGEIA